MVQFLKRVEAGNGKARDLAAQTVEAVDPIFANRYPALAEFLSAEEWEPGQARERGTLTLFFEDGAFKAAANDRDAQQVAFVSKGAFQALLDALEKGLVAGSLDWRGQQQKKGGSSKRR